MGRKLKQPLTLVGWRGRSNQDDFNIITKPLNHSTLEALITGFVLRKQCIPIIDTLLQNHDHLTRKIQSNLKTTAMQKKKINCHDIAMSNTTGLQQKRVYTSLGSSCPESDTWCFKCYKHAKWSYESTKGIGHVFFMTIPNGT